LDDTFYSLPCPVFSAFLSDFHNADPLPVLKSLETNAPEVILISGDLIFGDRPDSRELNMDKNKRSLELLRGCSAIAPTFMSLGNHEWMLTARDLELIRSAGTTVLDNQWVRYKNMLIGGLSSAYYTAYQALRAAHPEKGNYPAPISALRFKKIQPELNWLADFEKQEGFRILLCHHPEYFPRYLIGRPLDLILSGHAHGGQWRFYIPSRKTWQGVYAPGQGLFPQLTSGVHAGRLVISRGLSNPTIIPRINNPTEVIYLGKN